MVNAKKNAIESLYKDRCDIVGQQSYKKENQSTGHRDVTVIQDQPCRLSIENITVAGTADGAATIQQVTKLFIAPEIVVNPGSKIVVYRNGLTAEYKNSGVSAVYCSHQEIILELLKGWA